MREFHDLMEDSGPAGLFATVQIGGLASSALPTLLIGREAMLQIQRLGFAEVLETQQVRGARLDWTS